MVLDPTLDLTPVVGSDGFQQLPDYLDITPSQASTPTDTGAEIATPPQKQADTDWADISTKVFTAMREEVPAVPTSSSFFERFEGVTDIVGKPIDKIMDVLSLPADVTERGIGMAAGLLYWNDVDLATRWQLGQLTYEAALGGADTGEIMKRIHAGEDPEKVINDYEGGWADMLTKLVIDPMNLFGVPGLGLAAKALPEGSRAAGVLRAANKGITLGDMGGLLGKTVKVTDRVAIKLPDAGPPEGYVRLYRAGTDSKALAKRGGEYVRDMSGRLAAHDNRWFTHDLDLTDVLKNQYANVDGPTIDRLYYVDVPKEVADASLLNNLPLAVQQEIKRAGQGSWKHGREYLLPDEYANAKVPLESVDVAKSARPNPTGKMEGFGDAQSSMHASDENIKRASELRAEARRITRGEGEYARPYGIDLTAEERDRVFALNREANNLDSSSDVVRAWDDLNASPVEPFQDFVDLTREENQLTWLGRLVSKSGIGVGEDERIAQRLIDAAEGLKRSTMTGDEVRLAGTKWFAKPTNKLRGLLTQTIESKRNEMGYSFMLNADQMAREENDWASIRNYVGEMFAGVVDGSLTQKHQGFRLAIDGTRYDQPAALMGINAIGEWAAKTGATLEDLPSMRKPWFDGPPEAWKLLPEEAQKAFFPNKDQWIAAFVDDMHNVIGHGNKPGAFDLYAGMASLGGKPPVPPTRVFTTEKGSRYTVNPDGTTTRFKTATGEQFTPSSETFYTDENGSMLVQASRGVVKKTANPNIVTAYDDQAVRISRSPRMGLHPVEVWADGSWHIGHKITSETTTHAVAASGADIAYLDPTGAQLVGKELEKMHGIVKNGMSIFWLNTPRYAISNAVSNSIRGITAVGDGAWRWDERIAQRFGKEAIDIAAADPARLREVHVADQAGAAKKSIKDWVIRPWVKMGADNRWFGDNAVRKKVALLTAKRFMQQHYVPGDESTFGVIKAIDWGDAPDEAVSFLRSKLRESWDNPRAFIDEVRSGSVSLSPSHTLYDKALESLGVQGEAKWQWRDLLGEDVVRQIDDAYQAAASPEEFVRNLDRIAGKQLEFTSQFVPMETLTQKGSRTGVLFETRLLEEKQILQYEHERMALMGRVVESRGQSSQFLKDTVQAHVREQQKRLKALYEKLDLDIPNGVDDAKKLRSKEIAAYDKWEDQAWSALSKNLQKHYGLTDSQLAKFFDGVNVDRIATSKGQRAYRNEAWKKVDALDNGRHDPGAATWYEQIAADRAKRWDEHFGRIAAPFGISRLPKAAEVPGDYAHTFAEGYVRMHEDTTRVLAEMKKHAASIFTEGGLKRGVALTPEQSQHILSQLDTLEEDANLARTMALRAGRMMADHALLNYDRKYGVDDILKYVFPYHFWPSRMAHRYFRAALARPGAAGAFGVLVKGQYDITEGMPDRFKGKIGIPVPFLPDWMGDSIYIDPIKMLFPFAQGIDPGIGDEETFAGRVDSWMSSVGAGAAPWITMPLQMVGAFGEREKWIRYQMQGMPLGLPGTPAQQAITHFLMGDAPDEYDGELTPDDIRTITLGEAFPEPRLRELLGMPPGDQWDYYRVLRMLASMAGDGTVTAEQAMRAAKDRSGPVWDQAKSQAATENGIRVLSSWAFGLPGTIYSKGEETQNGLDAMFRVARESDRKGGSDGNIATFFDAFPEYQVRQIQKSFYRGKEELDSEVDTNLYYIDLNKIQEQYDPEIDYYEKVKAATPKGQRKDVSNILESLYEQRRKGINDLKIRYAKRKLTPSVYANPYDRALSMLREQYYNVDGDTIQSRQGAQLLFLQKLTGKGMEGGYYKLGQEADRIIEEYDAKIAGASNNERDDLYRARMQAIESLTSNALTQISVQDFMAYLEKRKREPSDEEAKRQQASDALRTFFHAPQEARSAVFMKYPTLAAVYGQNPTEELAGALDAWWANYDRLTPNSVARDDYVQSTANRLNAIREALGMKPMQPRQRASAAPLTANVDPYIMSLVEAGMPGEQAPVK